VLRRALEPLGEIGDERRLGETLWRLGLALDALGARGEVRPYFERALTIFEQLHAPEAEQLRVLLGR
jgi:hypothetical protein